LRLLLLDSSDYNKKKLPKAVEYLSFSPVCFHHNDYWILNGFDLANAVFMMSIIHKRDWRKVVSGKWRLQPDWLHEWHKAHGDEIKIVQNYGRNEDFYYLCHRLEKFQYDLIPRLAEESYSLTDSLYDIKFFVLYVGDEPVGCIGLKEISKTTCEIVRVYVCDKHRGKGYAKLLFEKIEDLARKLKYKKAEMVTWADFTSALALYKKLGYTCSERKTSGWFKGLKYFELHKNLKTFCTIFAQEPLIGLFAIVIFCLQILQRNKFCVALTCKNVKNIEKNLKKTADCL
jgi:GNAT superfamily N-acetyltransferase